MPIGLVTFGGRTRSTSSCGVVVLVHLLLLIFQPLMQEIRGSGVGVVEPIFIERELYEIGVRGRVRKISANFAHLPHPMRTQGGDAFFSLMSCFIPLTVIGE